VQDAYVIGVCSTAFTKHPDRTHESLAEEVVAGVLADAHLDGGGAVESVWFANCSMGTWGQSNIRGQACLSPMMKRGALDPQVPIINVEGGCATGSMALHGAVKDVWSGEQSLALAVGVEKTFVPDDPVKIFEIFAAGADRWHEADAMAYFREAAEQAGLEFAPRPDRIFFLDTYALQAEHHMHRWGTTQAQIAAAAAKNHNHGALNPKAQYQIEMTAEQVLADKPVVGPLTRSMCAPISDGAAAVLVCAESALASLPPEARERAVRVGASALAGGRYRTLDEPSVTEAAAAKAYRRAQLIPDDIDVVELHDSTAFCEIYQLEMLGFSEAGGGGPMVESGATTLGGRLPVNPSGGLESKGHPLAATGLSMIDELVTQLRGEAGPRQVEGASVALQQNAGGLMGFDEAACAVHILDRR